MAAPDPADPGGELTDSDEEALGFCGEVWLTDSDAWIVPSALRIAANWALVMQTGEGSLAPAVTQSCWVLSWPKLPTAEVMDWAKPETVVSIDVSSDESA